MVLAGCETGQASTSSSEYISLASTFLFAGARAVVASMWIVDSNATRIFMKKFYKVLSTQVPIDQALQMAQSEFKNSSEKVGGNERPFILKKNNHKTQKIYMKEVYCRGPFFIVGSISNKNK